jgi:hypothetical protein
MQFRNTTLACLIALLAAGCGAPATFRVPPPREQQPISPSIDASTMRPPAGANLLRIDPRQSELRVFAFRSGPMSQLGHDHVIVNRSLSGWVDAAPRLEAASFFLQIPVAEFAVDEASARAAAGGEFAQAVSLDVSTGTRRNMLGGALLNAEQFPLIVVRSIGIDGMEPRLSARLRVTVAGRDSTLTVPFTLERAGAGVTATADWSLSQSALGLTPFGVLGGALRVRDDIRIHLVVVAFAGQS